MPFLKHHFSRACHWMLYSYDFKSSQKPCSILHVGWLSHSDVKYLVAQVN